MEGCPPSADSTSRGGGGGGGGGGEGGCPRKTACKKKKKVFWTKGPQPSCIRPWESKHWNEFLAEKKKIGEQVNQKLLCRESDWWDVGLVVQKARKQGIVC